MPTFYTTVINDMLTALAYLANRRVIHGDLKPGNILCNRHRFSFYLTGFGCAQYQGQMEGLLGTDEYLAPEVRKHQSEPRSDLWSLGIVGLEMLHLLPANTGASLDRTRWIEEIMRRKIHAPEAIKVMLEPDVRNRKHAHQIPRACLETRFPRESPEPSKSRSSMQIPRSHHGNTTRRQSPEQTTTRRVQNEMRRPDPSRSVQQKYGVPMCEPPRPRLSIQPESKLQIRDAPAGQPTKQSRHETDQYILPVQRSPDRRGPQRPPAKDPSPGRWDVSERRERQRSPE